MMNWKTSRTSDRREVDEIQTDKEMINRILLPFAADDDQRTELFDMLMDVINEVTTTDNRIEVVSGSSFVTIRRVH